MAEPTDNTMGAYYGNMYLQTHAQRIQLAQQMAAQEQTQAYALAKLYESELANINNNIARLKDAKTNKDFDRYLSLLQLENSTQNAAFQRTIAVNKDIAQRFDITPYEANIMQQADTYATNISGATTSNAAASRMLRQINPQVKGSDTAHALATYTYDQMQAAAARKGSGALAKFNADAGLKEQVAQHFGVKAGDITTLAAYKEAQRARALQEAGAKAPTVSKAQMKAAAELAGLDYDEATGKVIPAQGMTQEEAEARLASAGGAIPALEKQRAAAEAGLRQQQEIAGRTPEETMLRARQIYKSEFSPQTIKQMRTAGYDQIYQNLPPEMQLIQQGFMMTTPEAAKFLTKSRKDIQGERGSIDREERELAYDMFYAAQKAKKAGKQVDFMIHERAAEVFSPERFEAAGLSPEEAAKEAMESQRRVLGYIMRGEERIQNPFVAFGNERRIKAESKQLLKEQERIAADIEAQQQMVAQREQKFTQDQAALQQLRDTPVAGGTEEAAVRKEQMSALQASLTEQAPQVDAEGLYPMIPNENAEQIMLDALARQEQARQEAEIEALVAESPEEEAAANAAREQATGIQPAVQTATGPALNQFYPMKGAKYGYKFKTADTVVFVDSKGKEVKTFKPGDATYNKAFAEANAAYQNSLGK